MISEGAPEGGTLDLRSMLSPKLGHRALGVEYTVRTVSHFRILIISISAEGQSRNQPCLVYQAATDRPGCSKSIPLVHTPILTCRENPQGASACAPCHRVVKSE